MNYIVFDLEWNRVHKSAQVKCPDEIIQIGAVKLAPGREAQRFIVLVRPAIYKTVDSRIERMTGVTLAELLRDGLPFPRALKEFKRFVGPGENLLLSWGLQDAVILKRNCAFYNKNMSYKWITGFADLQQYVTHRLPGERDSGNQLGLAAAADLLGVSYDESVLHNALADAQVSADVFEKAFDAAEVEKYAVDPVKISSHAALPKNDPVLDLSKIEADEKAFQLACPVCTRMMEPVSDWFRLEKKFIRLARCNRCKSYFHAAVEVLRLYTGDIKYRKKFRLLEKIENIGGKEE
jgi:DNA polymerase III epsilon subunit-like protein